MTAILDLRDYQVETRYKAEASKARRIVLQAPTGSGKTISAIDLTIRALGRGERVTCMVPRIELIPQFTTKLDQFAPFSYGVIAASGGDRGAGLYAGVQVCSVDTLIARAVKSDRMVLPPADLVFCDEVHLYATALRQELLAKYPTQRIIGMTATPVGLGAFFDEMIQVTTTKQLIERGYLVKPYYYAPSMPDLKNMRMSGDDYNQEDVAQRMEPLIGDIPQHWLQYAADRRTMLYTSKVGHSMWMAKQFLAAGVAAEHVDAKTPPRERANRFARLRSGETQMLCNVGLATYGIDIPEISCIVMATATKSLSKYLQMGGRGLRPAPWIGKSDLLMIDHGGNWQEHGYLEDDRHWTLDGAKRKTTIISEPRKRVKSDPEQQTVRLICPKCKSVFEGALECSQCGFFYEAKAQQFYVHEGELVPYNIDEDESHSEIERMRFYCELLGHAKVKGYAIGWAGFTFKEKFKEWPPRQWQTYDPMEPSIETKRYLKYLTIRKVKARAKAANG